MKRLSFILIFLLIVCCGSGCARRQQQNVMPKPQMGQRNDMPSPETLFASLPPEEGSLWTDSGNMMFVDQKARRVGDTVIVDIVEKSSSKLGANTKVTKENSIEANLPDLLGYMAALKAKNPNLDPDDLISSAFKHEATGTGESDRSGEITGSIGAIVTSVLPNGNITIFGQRELKVNNEAQYITVSGIVRPKDIDGDNRVKSTYLADARIEYSGRGVIADTQKVGWLTRVLAFIWPF